ncbi:MAG: hypothetical protein QOE46_2281 [Acidobacteriota bacterium]|jgi:hypothetical protein|nr:hypothetical protein [Acidobacteriota bacterium]
MPKRPTRANPLIVIKSMTKLAPEEEVRDIIKALQHQVTHDFEPAWGTGATIKYDDGQTYTDAYRINIRRTGTRDDDGYLGYHFSDAGYPIASIFAEEDMKDDKTISTTLSHEILEMLVDPACNLYAHRPAAGSRSGRGYFYEVCDAVQCVKYEIGRHQVCDFVYPEWFEHVWPAGSRKFDHLGKLNEPFEVLEGCYADVYEGRHAGVGRFRTIWGGKEGDRRGRHRLNHRLTSGGHKP